MNEKDERELIPAGLFVDGEEDDWDEDWDDEDDDWDEDWDDEDEDWGDEDDD